MDFSCYTGVHGKAHLGNCCRWLHSMLPRVRESLFGEHCLAKKSWNLWNFATNTSKFCDAARKGVFHRETGFLWNFMKSQKPRAFIYVLLQTNPSIHTTLDANHVIRTSRQAIYCHNQGRQQCTLLESNAITPSPFQCHCVVMFRSVPASLFIRCMLTFPPGLLWEHPFPLVTHTRSFSQWWQTERPLPAWKPWSLRSDGYVGVQQCAISLSWLIHVFLYCNGGTWKCS